MYRILYVDDDPGLLEIGKLFLERKGQLRVDISLSASAGLDLLASADYDAVITDYQMPGMDGIEFLKKVRTSGNTIPFILFTGRGREEIVIQALNEGADFYLQKGGEPVAQFAELTHKIRVAVQRRTTSEALNVSETRFRGIFDTITSGVAIYEVRNNGASGKDYIIKDFNKTALEIEGKTKEEVIGKSLLDLRPAIDEYGLIPVFQQVFKTGVPAYFPQKNYIDEKYSSWYENRVFRLPSGEIVAVYDDVTERKRAELELESALENLNEAHRLAHIGTWDWVAETDTVTWSEELCTIVGWDHTKPAPTYAELPRVYTPASWERLNDAVTRALATGESYNLELEMVRPDGGIRWTNAFGGVKYDGNGKVAGLQGTVQDITERNLLDDTLTFLVQCGYSGSGEDFFNTLARYLAEHLDMSYVCIDTLEGDGLTARTVAIYNDGEFETNVRYALKDTPCGDVVGKTICCYPTEVCRIFPRDAALQDLKAESYIGTTLWSSDRIPIGLIALIGQKPLKNPALAEAVLQLVAVRAAGEMERRRAEEALKISQIQLVEAMDLASVVNWEFDVATGIFTFNDRFYALYGTTTEREGGFHMPVEGYSNNFVHPEDRFMVADEVRKAILATDPGYVAQAEHRIIRRDGEIRDVVVRFGIIKDENGRTIKTHGANQDITERKRTEEALREANKKLTLLSSITRHDILNQLMLLKGYLELSHEVIDNPTTINEYITIEEKAANAIEHQITFTKIYQELGAAAPVWQNVNANIQKVVAGLPMREVRVEVGCTNLEIFADPLFEKVFYNLIDNALHYGGDQMTTIRVSSQESDRGLIVVCEDDGVGISQEDRVQLFTRGFGKNTGLGLFLSREILGITGITITEKGTPGKGARFEITVPKGAYRHVTGEI